MFEEFRYIPGFDVEKTASLNQAGFVDGALVRWNEGFVEKLGGWNRFYPFSLGSPIRAMWPWQDLNLNNRLAVGSTQSLKVITAGAVSDITPQTTTTSSPPNFSTTAGSNVVTIIDANITNPNAGSFVFLREQVFAGGIILFGIYQIQTVLGANTYTINAAQNAVFTAARVSPPAAPTLSSVAGGALGAATYFVKVTYVNPSGESAGSAESSLAVAANNLLKVTSPAASGTATAYNVYAVITFSGFEVLQTATPIALGTDWTEPVSGLLTTTRGFLPDSTGGALPLFTATSGSAQVQVQLPGHGLTAGQTALFLDNPGFIGPGVFQVQNPITTNTYTISIGVLAPSSTTAYQNSDNLVIVYYVNLGPQPTSAGWGTGTYGGGTWGIGNPPASGSGTPITATDWSLLNFGDTLIANPPGQPLFQWSPESGQTIAGIVASILGAGPITADGIILSQPIQIIIAWGASFNGSVQPMRLVWCDAGNFLQWTPSSTNFAGGFTIPRGSKIVACVQGANQFTVHTDLGVWSGQFVGQPLVFSIIEVMNGCGLVGRKALGIANNTIYWLSQQQPFQMSVGGLPTPMQCPIWDRIFFRIDKTALDKVRFFANSQFNEIGWYFPVSVAAGGGTGENTEYVKYNTLYSLWDYGPIGRSAWIDQSILGPPMGSTVSGFIFQHETSPDADGVAMTPFVLTGNYKIAKGEEYSFLDYFIPDAIYGYNGQPQNATLLISFLFRNFPNDTPIIEGPFPSNAAIPFIEPSKRGRLVQIKYQSQDLGTWWRLGLPLGRVAPDGRNPM